MSKPARIYTRTGDDGTTGLVGGQRVRKDALRISAYGTVDELSSVIGVARTALADALRSSAPAATPDAKAVISRTDAWLAWTQDVLFNVGSDLATLSDNRHVRTPIVTEADIAALERAIDEAQDALEPLTAFIHPGGSYPGAFLHQARTVARRAERLLVTLHGTEPVSPETLRYLNRLSDALFVWSRSVNRALCQSEQLWNPRTHAPG
jgi:cob(I)alamin adenosyltransferase